MRCHRSIGALGTRSRCYWHVGAPCGAAISSRCRFSSQFLKYFLEAFCNLQMLRDCCCCCCSVWLFYSECHFMANSAAQCLSDLSSLSIISTTKDTVFCFVFLTNRGLYCTAESGHAVPQTGGHALPLSTLEQYTGVSLYKNRLVTNVKPLFCLPVGPHGDSVVDPPER